MGAITELVMASRNHNRRDSGQMPSLMGLVMACEGCNGWQAQGGLAVIIKMPEC